MPRRFLRFLIPLLLLVAGAASADGPSVSANLVWIRQAPPGVEVMAGYLTLTNHTDHTLTLDSVSSPNFGSVAVHRTVQEHGMDSMQPVESLTLPPHGSVMFASGGYHLMLMKPVKPLFDGDLVTLTLRFSDHSSLTIMAPVRRDAPQS